jgi:glycosyltransferase involved in cell wall biosynthesis
LISIGLPVIKDQFLDQALKSILAQTFRDIEIIVVNNGSKENIKAIVEKYNDSRIRYFENETMLPIIENWNIVLNSARGEYFILFSDDDIAEPTYVEELVNLALKYKDVNIFHARVRIIDENNKTKYLATSCPEYETAADFIWHRIKNYRFHYAPDFMVKTEALKKLGGFIDFPKAWNSDDATWFSLANPNGIVASSKILLSWRESEFNLTSVGSVSEKLEAIDMFFNWLNNFLKNDLILHVNDSEILEEIKKNIGFRKSVQNGYALKLTAGKNPAGILKIIFVWLKFRKHYLLNATSLAWGFALFFKNNHK